MSAEPPDAPWSLYAAAQCLPAVLTDPRRGKQANFFTRTWGDAFAERAPVERSPHLPEVALAHFDAYRRKVGRRFKRHQRLQAPPEPAPPPADPSLDQIPDIFLRQDFPLNSPAVFRLVFGEMDRENDHLLQEKLSHYLDVVEVQISRQVAQKSGAFFHAMTSHDTIMEQMQVAAQEVATLRTKIATVDKTLAKDSLKLIGLSRAKSSHGQLADKLKLMSIVLQTQPTLQLLLSSSDYVGALELIASTQEVLARELAGVTSLRHLPSQLKEMSKLIDKMLSTEFERYAAADLHRPFNDDDNSNGVLEEERLISLVAGLLRQNHLQFLEIYKQEAITASQTLIKQLLIEELAADDLDTCLTGAGEVVAPALDSSNWLRVLSLATSALEKLLHRVRTVHDVIKTTAATSAGLLPTQHHDKFLTHAEHARISTKLRELLHSICDYCHERLASLVSSQSEAQITAKQIQTLSQIVDNFVDVCEQISGKQSPSLRAAFKIQAGNYVYKFHNQRKTKLTLLLDAERWRSADVPGEIQHLVDNFSGNEAPIDDDKARNLRSEPYDTNQTTPFLRVGTQNYNTVGTVLILVQLVSEYCQCAKSLPVLASTIGRNLTELLRGFNSRSCQLVLGAGALRTAGLKTITSTNLALTSRSLQLVLWLIPHVRRQFAAAGGGEVVGGFDGVAKDIGHHVQQLEVKVLSIMGALVGDQLSEWDAKPPVPSRALRNVSRHLVKLHEAVGAVLPPEQVSDIYEVIHKNFKTRLRDQLIKMNIQNNGGPQHGVVTTEIIFYLETLKNLKVLPDKYLSDQAMNDIWVR